MPEAGSSRANHMSLRASDFKPHLVRCSFFTLDIRFDGNVALARLLLEKRDLLDGEVTSLPIPPEAPPGIPRIQIHNSDRTFVVEASPERFNVAWGVGA